MASEVVCFLLCLSRSAQRINLKEMTAMRKILWICVLAAGATLVQAAAGVGPDVRDHARHAHWRRGNTEPVLSGAVATAEVALDPTSEEIAVSMRVFNLPNGSTASHIHVGPKGSRAPWSSISRLAPAGPATSR